MNGQGKKNNIQNKIMQRKNKILLKKTTTTKQWLSVIIIIIKNMKSDKKTYTNTKFKACELWLNIFVV